jgi:hypothetical protein
MEARLFGRKVTPTSKMFPDIKFEAPYGQNWSTNRAPLRRRSEEESLVGGKFTITGFDGKKLIVEGRAMGGPVSGATPYMVGEKGPELFVPESSGKIIPNQYMAGGDVVAGRSAYGLSGNPAIRAQQEAERAARAASYVPAVVPAQPRAASPFSVGRGTTVGLGGVRTNVYGAQGSLPYMPGLTLGHTPMNMLSDSIQRTTVGIKMMGDSAATAYAKAGVQMTIAQQKMITSINTMGIKIVDSVKLMGNTINTAATNMATGIKAAAATAKASMSAFIGMANPGYAAGFGQNFKYGTSLMMMPFGRRSPQIDPSTGAPRVSNMGGGMMGSMATWMGGAVAGGAVGKKAGGETGALIGSIAGPLAIMGVLKLINSFRTLRFAGMGAGVALKTALGVIGRFIPIIGPLLSIGQLLWVWKRRSEDIGKSNRAVFGPTKKSLEEVGLKYKSLNDRLKDHRQQLELTRAKAAAYGQGGTQIAGLTLSLKELKAGIKDAKENAKESVQLFNMSGGGKEVNELAASLKQQYVSAGMSVQEATNQIYVLIKASKYGSQALEAISSKSFKSITDQASAADYALNLVAKNLSSGNFNAEEIAVGVQNIINSLDQYKSSLIGTKIDGDIISDAEALKLVLDKIEKSKAANLKLDKETLNNLKKQNIELNYVLNKNETLASTYAKIALLQSPIGEKLDLYAMDPKEAIDIARGAQVYSEAIEETVNKDLSLDKTIKKFENMAKAASKAAAGVNSVTYDNIIKQQNAIIKQLDKELQLRLKNLDAQEKAADFATNLKKEQLNYQKALMSGDMVAAAEAKLNIQQLEKENEIMLAKQAIQDATDKKKEAAQKKADEAQKKKDLLGEAAQSAQNASIDANTAATAFATFESTINRLVGRIGPDETLSATEKTILRTGLKDALDALKQSGKSGLDFVKNFTEQKMGKDQGISYLQGLANDSGDLAGSEKFAGKFASAVDLFFTAVQEFSGGKAYFSAPKDETRDIRFGADKVAMIFEGGGKSYGVITNKADSGKTYITWAEAGYKFRGYDKNYAKKGLVSPDMDQTTDRRTPPKLAMGGAIPGYADGGSYAPGIGGYIKGRGTPTSDSIFLPTGNGGLIRASNTEFMQPASAVSYYGTDFMEDIRARRIPKEIISAAIGGAIPGYPMGGLIPYAMGGAIPGYHEGGPVGHRHGRNAPSTSSSPKGSWWDKLGSKMTYKDGVLNPAGMLGFGILDMAKSLGAVALDSMAQGIFPARERDIASAAETTFVGPISRLLGSKRFPNPWGESGMGMSSGWAKGMDVATILSAIIPFGFAARTSQQTAANAALGSAAKTAPKIKITTPMSNKYFDGDLDLDDAVGLIPKKVMPAKYSMDYDPSGGYHRITVKDGDEVAGYLTWNKETGVVENLQVYDAHKGNYIGTTMYKHAQTIAPITHSPFRTPAGDAFAYSIGDAVVPLDKNWLPGDWSQGQLDAAAARAADRASGKNTGQPAGGYSTGVMDTPKGMPVPFDPLYLAYLEQIGRRPFTITGGGSSARRGLIKSTNKLFSALHEGKRLDLLPTPRAFKFTKSDHYDSSIEEIQLHQKIGSKNPAYLKNPKGRIGPEFPTFIHEMGHAWDLGSAAGGRSRSIFKERFPGISPEAKTMSFQQDDVYSGIKEGTADWYLNEVFPLLKDKIPPAYAEQFSRRLSRSYVSGAGKLTVRDILAPGGAYLKKDGKINPGRQHQVTKDFLSGYLDSSTHLVPEVRSALERTLEILEKFYVGRSIISHNRQSFGYPDSMSMEDILTDRLTKAFNYADMHGLAMGGAVNPTYSANMSVPTYQMGGMIPKFHNGGQVNTKFAGGETMALLKDKEMVFTQDQMAALGSITSTPNQSVPTSITYAPVINAAPGMDEEMLANLVMVKLGTATNIRYKANGSSGMRVIK